jgi:hypothetical protein
MAARPQGTPLGLLLRPSATPRRGPPGPPRGLDGDESWWHWSPTHSQAKQGRLGAAIRLTVLAVSVGAGAAASVVASAAGLWWWLAQLGG